MKQIIPARISFILLAGSASSEDLKSSAVPPIVNAAFATKYPIAQKVSREKEKGNFETNWGEKSGEDNSGVFAPSAEFLETVVAIPVDQLPAAVAS